MPRNMVVHFDINVQNNEAFKNACISEKAFTRRDHFILMIKTWIIYRYGWKATVFIQWPLMNQFLLRKKMTHLQILLRVFFLTVATPYMLFALLLDMFMTIIGKKRDINSLYVLGSCLYSHKMHQWSSIYMKYRQ